LTKDGLMDESHETYAAALTVAKLYYYEGLTTEMIGRKLDLSRPKVSRLLSFARQKGLVEIRVVDRREYLNPLARTLYDRFGISDVQIVPVTETAGEEVWLEEVATFTANYLNGLMQSDTILAIAWGTTVSEVSKRITPKAVQEVDIVQLNGAGNTYTINNTYTSEIIRRFASAYGARTHLFPVPTFFDYAATKTAMWRERSVRRILELQQKAGVVLFSIGAVNAGVPSHVYAAGYLEQEDLQELEAEGVVGDLATVFYRDDGSYQGISLNERASGPELKLYQDGRVALCVVSGLGKARGLRAALGAGYLSHLVVDEPTAREVLRLEGIPHEELTIR